MRPFFRSKDSLPAGPAGGADAHWIEHRIFLVGVWIKGLAGLVEAIGGALALAVNPTLLRSFVLFLTAPELAEDPSDLVANFLRRSIRHYSGNVQLFTGVYLVAHGVIKIGLVVGLLREKLWAYPLSLWFVAAFVLYQSYRFAHTHSAWLLFLTAFDLGVMALIWREYRWQERRLHADSPPP
ncbi:MAG: DUF2127 domain-containing protein [Betaproteobacteria bacterium]|nr:DUF2127 domain-containing protein [Betaproteobacteria bacterium]